ncbi:MAG: FAD-dependent oxidoreductase, partial [Bacteroidota bacterium]|nr:FAD-dependent oxidoreductase [Bacteroidota bacterium]
MEPAFGIPDPNASICLDTVVIGAGQAGLAAAYYLRQRGHNFRILEAAPTAGAAWAARYDSLRLFSPAWASGLPGRPWPGNPLHYPTRDETVAYLRDYAAHFDFPIDTGQRVVRLRPAPDGAGYEVSTAAGRHYLARHVIIATGPYTTPHRPAWAAALPPAVAQLHSRDYQRPAQLPGTGPVAVVGSGNSAVQIAADLAATGRAVAVAFDEQTTATPNNNLMWAALTLSRFLRIPVGTALGSWIRRQPEGVVRHDLLALRKQPTAHFVGRATGVL